MAPEHEARTRALYDHESDEPTPRAGRSWRQPARRADWGVGEDIFDRMPSRRFTRADRRAEHHDDRDPRVEAPPPRGAVDAEPRRQRGEPARGRARAARGERATARARARRRAARPTRAESRAASARLEPRAAARRVVARTRRAPRRESRDDRARPRRARARRQPRSSESDPPDASRASAAPS